MPDYGSGGIYEVQMDGPFSGGGRTAEIISQIVILKDSWKGATSPYSQKIEIPNASVNSKVEIQLDAEQLERLSQQRFTMAVGNSGGEFTVYAVGDKPRLDIDLQISLTDVLNVGSETREIYGNAISTHNPRSDYLQKDPSMADFIQNMPTEEIEKIKEIEEKADGALPKKGGSMEGKIDMVNNPISNLADPVSEDQAANKKYVDAAKDETKQYIDNKIKPFTCVLTSNGWVGDKAPYKQTIGIEGILGTDRPHYGPVYSESTETALAEREAFAMVDDLDTADGSVTFTCFEDNPEVNLTIQMEVHR